MPATTGASGQEHGVGAVRQNRLIPEPRKSSATGRRPDHPAASQASGRAGHWWEILTRTLPGRLVLLLSAVALIGLITAAFGHFVLGAFSSFGEALWSAIAHLVDPGSIGDDHTTSQRITGLIQVIAGIIFFAGIVLTVLTEVVDRALRRLEKDDPAVRRHDHLLIIGYNSSLWEVQERLRLTAGEEPPEIVVMLPLGESQLRDSTRRALAGYPSRATVVVAEPDDDGFQRVCAGEARGIVLLSPTGDPDAADLEVTDRASLLERFLAGAGDAAPSVAVEFRRGRNVKAFWQAGADGSESRFPESFDALVNDRNIGAILLLAAMNPVFAELLLESGDGDFAPELIPVESWSRRSFGEARAGIESYNLLGILSGSGPQASATYLPDPEQTLHPGDRLIAVPTDAPPAEVAAAGMPDSVKVVPTRPGPVLMIGWSDASGALTRELEENGLDTGILHLLDRELPASSPTTGEVPVRLLEGDPTEPADIAAAISAVGPDIILVAVAGGNESAAIISGMLARQVTDVPILVEQSHDDRTHRNNRIAAGLTVVSIGGIVAESVALSLGDPAVLVAREGMLDDPTVALESLTYTGTEALPVAELGEAFRRSGAVPLAISLNGDDDTHLRAGDHILAFHRRAGS